jgi:hypothetical protein
MGTAGERERWGEEMMVGPRVVGVWGSWRVVVVRSPVRSTRDGRLQIQHCGE